MQSGMEYVYAALLLHSAGAEITEEKVAAVLNAAGISADMGRVKALVQALNGVNIEEAISQAQPAFAPVAAPTAAPTAAPAEAAPAAESEPAKAEAAAEKEEKKKEEELSLIHI